VKVFDNRLLRRIFGPKREEVTVQWRKLNNGEFNGMQFSNNIFSLI